MSEEVLNKIKMNVENSLIPDILNKIVKIDSDNFDGYQVIQVFLKENAKVKDMGIIMKNIQSYAKELGYVVVVDFLRG